jgi:hypothetical protein
MEKEDINTLDNSFAKYDDGEFYKKLITHWEKAHSYMKNFTKHYPLYVDISKNRPVHKNTNKGQDNYTGMSNGYTLSIMRKTLNQAMQRVPDVELSSIYSESHWCTPLLNYLLKTRVQDLEYSDENMFSFLKDVWKSAWKFGWASVVYKVIPDADYDYIIKPTKVHWNDFAPQAGFRDITNCDEYFVREYVPRSFFKNLDCSQCPTYNKATVDYILDKKMSSTLDSMSIKDQEKEAGNVPNNTIEVITRYKRGIDEQIVSFIPGIDNGILEIWDNKHPRGDVPISIMLIERDDENPCGQSQFGLTLKKQQYSDAFDDSALKTLFLDLNPPIIKRGDVKTSMIKFQPNSVIDLGLNDKNSIEFLPLANNTVRDRGNTSQGLYTEMVNTVAVGDQTMATDAGLSKTPQGVEQQDKQITVSTNTYQKELEYFFRHYCTDAINLYLAEMKGVHKLMLPAEVREDMVGRGFGTKIMDIDPITYEETWTGRIEEMDDNGYVEVDFSQINTPVRFLVKAGSLVESDTDKQQEELARAIVSMSQALGSFEDGSPAKKAAEMVMLKMVIKQIELSGIAPLDDIVGVLDKADLEAMQALNAPQQPQMPDPSMNMQPPLKMPPMPLNGLPNGMPDPNMISADINSEYQTETQNYNDNTQLNINNQPI